MMMTSPPRGADDAPLSRLVVLAPTPGAGVDLERLAHAVAGMAQSAPARLKVLFLGLDGFDARNAYVKRRCLTDLAAMTRRGSVEAEAFVSPAPDWLSAVRHVLQPGDLVVCLADQKTCLRGLGPWPLSEAIEWLVGVPVCTLAVPHEAGYEPAPAEPPRGLEQKQLFSLALPVAIVIAFFLLQVDIELTSGGVSRTLMLCASGLGEVGLLGLWSSFRSSTGRPHR